MMTRVLFVASEAYPLVKTGGLADVAGCLPEVLMGEGADVRLLLPAYGELLGAIEGARPVAELELAGTLAQLLETRLPGSDLSIWLLAHPLFSDRGGNPYHDDAGHPWPDNAERFMLLSRAAAAIALGQAGLDWQPTVLHCNDWHTGPAIALTHLSAQRPRTVFTIHNLAHMGIFDRATFDRLQLPEQLWQEAGMEFYGQCSFMKGGLVFADYITTVSPGYAEEICYSPGGMGLEGLLSARRDALVGILNGIDMDTWNPATDPHLAHHYDVAAMDGKSLNKAALQRELGLAVRDDLPLVGFIGRLVEQKGLELILPVLQEMLWAPAQFVLLGTGDPRYEQWLREIADSNGESMSVVLAYNEGLAHRIEAAADIFLMPSLFEPCGLNQLYSLRYGTLPLVRAVGGLADTVMDTNADSRAAGTATGFVFNQPESGQLLDTMRRAFGLWHEKEPWREVQRNAMRQDFSWQRSARRYMELYRS